MPNYNCPMHGRTVNRRAGRKDYILNVKKLKDRGWTLREAVDLTRAHGPGQGYYYECTVRGCTNQYFMAVRQSVKDKIAWREALRGPITIYPEGAYLILERLGFWMLHYMEADFLCGLSDEDTLKIYGKIFPDVIGLKRCVEHVRTYASVANDLGFISSDIYYQLYDWTK